MAQEYKIAIIGGGPAGCFCAYHLQNKCDVTIFEANSPLKTLLPTGGGRCNLAHAEYDFRELVKYYPRGEKFLFSIFSQFSTADTLDFFEKIGIKTYTQEDGRIFPKSNSSKDVREKFLFALKKVHFIKERALRVNPDMTVVTDNGSYKFDKVVIATGGHASYNIAKYLGHSIIEPKPALIGLKTDKLFPSGITLENVSAKFANKTLTDTILFTHQGISGPLAFKISSLMAREKFPYNVTLDLAGEIDLQKLFDANPHKSLKNLIGEILPKSLATELCSKPEIQCSQVNAKIRDDLYKNLRNLNLTITNIASGGETVTAGGIDLKEVNPKTLESKLIPNLYFCGEVLDIDGFCGGFNLQNCWSTAYVVASNILNNLTS